jgi:hypothetical protein
MIFLTAGCGDDRRMIRATLEQIWERPGITLKVYPITVMNRHSLAGWVQGKKGGIALLEKADNGNWFISICGDSKLAESARLQAAGMSKSDSIRLASDFKKRLLIETDERRELLDSFGKTIILHVANRKSPSD